MTSVHEIRLAGPWEIVVNEEAPTRTQLPISVDSVAQKNGNSISGVKLQRRFHAPSGLSDSTKLELVVSDSRPIVDLRINDQQLAATTPEDSKVGESQTIVYPISGNLQSFNILSIDLNIHKAKDSAIEQVILRIIEP